jgi:hypothetical protein
MTILSGFKCDAEMVERGVILAIERRLLLTFARRSSEDSLREVWGRKKDARPAYIELGVGRCERKTRIRWCMTETL